MANCCIEAADTLYRKKFPEGANINDGNLCKYLINMGKSWGQIPELILQYFTIRSFDEISLNATAQINPVKCSSNHESYLIAINERLYYFIWRVNLINAGYWKIEEKTLVPVDDNNWPSSSHIEQLKIAMDVYLGSKPLSAIGFDEFNKMFFGKHIIIQMLYKHVVDLAELFIILHECSHIFPLPDINIKIELPHDFDGIDSRRKQKWLEEMKADASATYALFLSAFGYYSEHFKLPKNEAYSTAAGIAFSAIDAVLHTLSVVETKRFGEVGAEQAMTDFMWASHPPAILRRNTFGFASQLLAQRVLGTKEWEKVRHSVSSMNYARQKLFDEYLKTT
jgi:hypothetical protein